MTKLEEKYLAVLEYNIDLDEESEVLVYNTEDAAKTCAQITKEEMVNFGKYLITCLSKSPNYREASTIEDFVELYLNREEE